MADIEITDEASLEAWLKTRPRRDAEIIAFRAAARVFPLWGRAMEEEWAVKGGMSATHFMRPLLILTENLASKVTVKYSLENLYDARTLEDAAFSAISSAYTLLNLTPFYTVDPLLPKEDTFVTSDGLSWETIKVMQAIFSARAAVAGTELKRDGTWWLDGSFDHSGRLSNFTIATWLGEFYRQIDLDCQRLTTHQVADMNVLASVPLWSGRISDWFRLPDKRTRAIWAKDPATWAFWEKWWDGVISGDMPFAEGLLRDVALIEDDIWQAGPKAVAEAIDKLITARALAMTDNGESVEINPETGKLRLVGADTLPPDIDRYARRKMAKALALCEGELSNQYRPLDVPLRIIRAALGDIENLPVELFDACASASRMTATLVETQSIPAPEQDPLIGEFVASLRETAADILAADTNTQDILTKRKAVTGNDTLIAHAGDINIVVGQIVVVSEGALQRMLPENADAALNPNAHPEERNVGAYKLASRLLRIHGKIREIGGTISDYKEVAGLVKLLWANPTFQSVIAAILKYLGLG